MKRKERKAEVYWIGLDYCCCCLLVLTYLLSTYSLPPNLNSPLIGRGGAVEERESRERDEVCELEIPDMSHTCMHHGRYKSFTLKHVPSFSS